MENNSHLQEINEFANRIVSLDMTDDLLSQQRQRWGNFIQNPLPEDSVSKCGRIFFPQLMYTVGDIADKFVETLPSISQTDQDRAIICAAAASGMGKTHMAYAVGKKHYVILIRVMGNNGNSNGEQRTDKSAPWDSALDFMFEARKRWNANHTDESDDISILARAKSMLRIVHVLVYTYLEFTANALLAVELESAKKKELVLRIHRNGESDRLIKALFEYNIMNLMEREDDGEYFLNDSRFKKYRKEVLQLTCIAIPPEETIVFCVDEINGLANDFRSDFVRRTHFSAQQQLQPDQLPTKSEFYREPRGLMYAVFCVFLSVTSKYPNWYCFVTGTSLSVALFQSEIDGISVARGSTIPLSPMQLLSVDNMLEILYHYFAWDTDSENTLRQKLQKFIGRPLFFAKGVLEPLYQKLCKLEKDTLSVSDFNNFEWLDKTFQNLCGQYTTRYSEIFGAFARPLPNGTRNTKSLLPLVIAAHLSNGKFCAPTENLVEGAVLTGILPMSVNSDDADMYTIDLNNEPIIKAAISGCVLQKLRQPDGCNKILSILCDADIEKGKKAEWMFAMHVVLKSERARTRNEQNNNTLNTLLEGLLNDEQRSFLPEVTKDYICECGKVIDMSNVVAERKSFLRAFIKADNSYDFQIVLFNINEYAGVDVAFLVKHKVTSQPRVVAVQAKNKASATLDDSLLTLNPGCQYLTNDERITILESWYEGRKVKVSALPKNKSISTGYSTALWNDHAECCKSYHNIGRGWFRVSLNARPVGNKLLRLVSDLRENRHTSQFRFFQRSDKKYQLISTSLIESPLIILSMQSSSYLTEFGRDRLIGSTQGELSKPRQFRRWVELTVENVDDVIALDNSLHI